MIGTYAELEQALDLVFPEPTIPPKPLTLIRALRALHVEGARVAHVASQFRTTSSRLRALDAAADKTTFIFGQPLEPMPEKIAATVRQSLGQLIIGRIAERIFEDVYKATLETTELVLEDDRKARGDTDYLVYNGQHRQVFRINIKFHGSQFRRARDLVGLDPENCFALATYKIHSALQRQQSEHLPYIFVIVGVPGLTGAEAGALVPENVAHLAALPRQVSRVSGVRLFEDHVVERLVHDPAAFGTQTALAAYDERIRNAGWYVLSARRADTLLRSMLFERAYALRVPRFAMNYRGAELDMHFSLSDDLRPLHEFLEVLKESGMTGLVTRLERGTL